ncbi:MAG: DUF2330 domain-containing protein [Deltaproteobacteria bacterium]|nr:DUF2330 domain-containing protein [Deltaproteobacteria bacterium]
MHPFPTQRPARLALGVAAIGLISGIALPHEAQACGGCFSPPSPVPDQTVVQDAERVLFVRDEATKKSIVWVEVRYSGLAKDFGWVLPVPKLPTVGVGSRIVFDALDSRMRMRYSVKQRPPENCRDPYEGCKEQLMMNASAGGGGPPRVNADAGATGTKNPGSPEVEVLAAGTTGPYDYVVIKGSDAAKLSTWLNDRGYETPKKATPIIQSHADKGDVFVAIKLSNGQGVEAIRPVVLEMDDAEACVPLRLTSIAASEDMAVVVTIGGPGRAVVKNHFDIVPNPMRMNLIGDFQYLACANKANYDCRIPKNMGQVIAAGIDEAAGHAFVTEAVQSGASLKELSPLQKFDLQELAALKNYDELAKFLPQSQLPITDEIAETFEPVLQLKKNFPKIAPVQMLANLKSCGTYWTMAFGPPTCDLPAQGLKLSHEDLQAMTFDGPALGKAMKNGIIDPLFTVGKLLGDSGKVTRLSMRISPEEMDRDPVFAYNPSLPDVPADRGLEMNQVCPNGWYPWYDGPGGDQSHWRISIDGLGSWVFGGNNNAVDARFKGAPAALWTYLQEESGNPIGIAQGQVAVVDQAIIGAKPGKPSLPKDLVINPPQPWMPPKSEPIYSKVGPWKKPGSWCTPKDGWADGQLPPKQTATGSDAGPDSSTGGADAGSSGHVPGVDAISGWDDAQAQPAAPSSGTGPAKKDSMCTAATAPQSGWPALLAALAAGLALIARRRGKA